MMEKQSFKQLVKNLNPRYNILVNKSEKYFLCDNIVQILKS